MSRSGKLPIPILKGAEVSVSGRKVSVKGPKGNLERELPEGVEAKVEEGALFVTVKENTPDMRRLHGLYRALLNSMVVGVAKGHEKHLELIGVGYRAAVKGQALDLQLGFSHPTEMAIPAGIDVKVEKNTQIAITGCDAQSVGQFAANVRKRRPPEPYKGKGVRYKDEYVRRKAGKAGKK